MSGYVAATTGRWWSTGTGPVRHALDPARLRTALCGVGGVQRMGTGRGFVPFEPEHERACPKCRRLVARS